MLKVSFKEDCQKVQVFNDRATIVTMVGQMTMPHELWAIFPDKVANWMWDHQGVDVQWGNCTKSNEGFRLELSGKSVCAKDDTFDAETGRRIAESRAKIRLYKFMYQLCLKLHDYYGLLLRGHETFEDFTHYGGTESINSCYLKYRDLLIKESYHLGKLLEEA